MIGLVLSLTPGLVGSPNGVRTRASTLRERQDCRYKPRTTTFVAAQELFATTAPQCTRKSVGEMLAEMAWLRPNAAPGRRPRLLADRVRGSKGNLSLGL